MEPVSFAFAGSVKEKYKGRESHQERSVGGGELLAEACRMNRI